jgi:CRISP-associated protein Cas1
MGTLYITQEDSFIGKIDERLTVKFDKKILQDIPLIKIDGIVILGRATISPATVSELLERHIPLTFLTENGRYLGRLEPEVTKNIFVRKAQWAAAGESPQAIHVVKGFVRGKLKNYRNVMFRRQREANLDLSKSIERIEHVITSIDTTHNINSLRGLEGAGSAVYFGCLNQMIRNLEFQFDYRNRRPPKDPVNSLLSFGYLHFERYGRASLAFDLMEEFRPLIVDALVLSTVNKSLLAPSDFFTEPLSGAVYMTPEGRKAYLKLYTQKKQSEFKHPVMGRKCTYQEAFEMQARLLAKYLMGEIDKYPPLILR